MHMFRLTKPVTNKTKSTSKLISACLCLSIAIATCIHMSGFVSTSLPCHSYSTPLQQPLAK